MISFGFCLEVCEKMCYSLSLPETCGGCGDRSRKGVVLGNF